MFVRSAAARIGRTPASTIATTPAIQVTRCGVPWRSTRANHGESRPSRLIENHTRVTPSRNVSMTVRIDSTAKIEMMFAITGSPTWLNAEAKPASGLISL